MTTTRPLWRHLSVGVAVTAIVGVLCPLPSTAAPTPCARPERYAAEAGAELMRLNRLDLRPAGRGGTADAGVDVGEARSAMLAGATVTSLAAARTLAGRPDDRNTPAELTRAVRQQAPPTSPAAAHANTPARRVGPFELGTGSLTSRAMWDPAMECGRGTGEITRARAVLSYAGLLPDRTGRTLVHLPRRLEARSTTALQRRGSDVHTVARASVTTGTLQVLGGAVQVTIVRPPTLATSISATGSADVRYVPAILEISGAGLETTLLTSPGDQAEISLDPPARGDLDPPARGNTAGEDTARGATKGGDTKGGDTAGGDTAGGDTAGGDGDEGDDGPESAAADMPAVPGDPLRRLLAALPTGPLPGVAPGEPLGLPRAPGAPVLPRRGEDGAGPSREESTGGTTRSMLRISIGEVRQAVLGNAVAARVAALNVQVTAGTAGDPTPGGSGSSGGSILDLDIGMLEAAAVAPDPAGGAAGGGELDAGSDSAGLPVTGSRIDLTVVAGSILLAVGLPCLVMGLRRRSFRA